MLIRATFIAIRKIQEGGQKDEEQIQDFDLQSESYRFILDWVSCIFLMVFSQRLILDMFRCSP